MSSVSCSPPGRGHLLRSDSPVSLGSANGSWDVMASTSLGPRRRTGSRGELGGEACGAKGMARWRDWAAAGQGPKGGRQQRRGPRLRNGQNRGNNSRSRVSSASVSGLFGKGMPCCRCCCRRRRRRWRLGACVVLSGTWDVRCLGSSRFRPGNGHEAGPSSPPSLDPGAVGRPIRFYWPVTAARDSIGVA